jgi:hypothetical protein
MHIAAGREVVPAMFVIPYPPGFDPRPGGHRKEILAFISARHPRDLASTGTRSVCSPMKHWPNRDRAPRGGPRVAASRPHRLCQAKIPIFDCGKQMARRH